ncbi:MAG: hypothetical protein VYE65_07310, partial [SAR324 cluster bacterium]|nr:hypothetical protein [SAR324 cluster bacterium]
METNFYVVGDNRGTEFFLKHIKFFLWLLIFIIFALSIAVTYQYFIRQLDQELLAERIQQEKALSENLIKKLKKTGQQDSEWEQQVLSQSSQQKKLNIQQASLLESQRNEIDELKSILQQREQVVRQFQLEKTSTQEQINNLQLKVRSVQQQLQSTQASLIESKAENEIVLTQKNKLESEKNKLEQKLNLKKRSKTAAKKIEPVKREINILTSKDISVEKLKINKKGRTVRVSYNLTNNSKRLQQGRTGMYLSSKQNLEKEIPFRL